MSEKYERLAQIVTWLYEGRGLKISQLAKEFGVSTKTIQRDFKELKSEFLIREGNVFFLRVSKRDQKESFVLDVLEHWIASIGGRFQEEALELLSRAKAWGDRFELPLQNISHKHKEISKIQQAIKENQALNFNYKGQRFQQIKALGLYAIGRCVYFRGGGRFFVLEEMHGCRLSKPTDLECLGSVTHRVSLYIYPQKASEIQAMSWGENQNNIYGSDGSLIIEFDSRNQEVLLREILAYLPHILILEPQTLRERLDQRILAYINKSRL